MYCFCLVCRLVFLSACVSVVTLTFAYILSRWIKRLQIWNDLKKKKPFLVCPCDNEFYLKVCDNFFRTLLLPGHSFPHIHVMNLVEQLHRLLLNNTTYYKLGYMENILIVVNITTQWYKKNTCKIFRLTNLILVNITTQCYKKSTWKIFWLTNLILVNITTQWYKKNTCKIFRLTNLILVNITTQCYKKSTCQIFWLTNLIL